MKFIHHLDFLSIIIFSFTFIIIESEAIHFSRTRHHFATDFLSSNKTVEKHNNHFDFMLFAQIWPISGCLEWEDRSPDNTCYLPSKFFFQFNPILEFLEKNF